jgi:glycosyltransferase involved in cell wall biosynthesis
VLEVLRDADNGITVDFFSHRSIASRIEEALDQQERMQALRKAARATAVKQFDLEGQLLPRWMALFGCLANGRRPAHSAECLVKPRIQA